MRWIEVRAMCILAVGLVALGAPSQALAQAGKAPAGGPQEAGSPGGWWNSSRAIETLTLTEAQRKKMDEHLASFQKKMDDEGPRTLTSFYEALQAGKWDEARAELKTLAKRSSERMLAQGELKIQILRELDDAQRAKLAEHYTRLLRQPWGNARRQQRVRGPR